MLNKSLLALALTLSMLGSTARADAPAAKPAMTAEQFESSLQRQSGKIALPGGLATLNLPASFSYLSPSETGRVLEAWGNPPGSTTLGMIVPAKVPLMSKEGWGVIVACQADGHVQGDEANAIK